MKLSQLAYARFKEGLMDRRIRPGAVMSQADLSEIVGVPVGPLREAVQVLESEGLLTVMPRSGIRITKPDMETIRNVFQLRRIVEREAASRFAELVQGEALDRQEADHRAVIDAVEAGKAGPALWDRSRAVDIGLHRMLIERLRNPMIAEVFERLHLQITLVRLEMEYELSASLIRRTMQEHLRIIAALRGGDAEAAGAAMDEHLTQAMHRSMWL